MFDYIDMISKLSMKSEKKIVMVVMDGIGGMERELGGKTELAAANTPNLDKLAAEGVLGLLDPIAPGFTPGSGPAHLALFGYDPVKYDIGRGILAASGIGFVMNDSDIAGRGNFATIDATGAVTDRRAGRISTEVNAQMCDLLQGIEIDGIEVFVKPVKEHRCVVIFRGEGLGGALTDSDPQKTGLPALDVKAQNAASEKAAVIVNKFQKAVKDRLAGQHPANFMLLRGFDAYPKIPKFGDFTKMNPASIAVYPDYKGVTRIIGMDVLDSGAETIESEFDLFAKVYDDYDFFYVHVKKTDSYGEDGNFDRKVAIIEETDALLPKIMNMNPDVMIVTGDHSTPAALKGHSWHPVPLLLRSDCCRRDGAGRFDELACVTGGLGRLPSVSLLPIAMSNAGKLLKFGA